VRIVTLSARAERTQIVERIDPRAVPVFPAKFNRVVSHCSDIAELCIRDRYKLLRSRVMALAESTGTVAAQVPLSILSDMAVVPGDAHFFFCPDVIDLDRYGRSHGRPQLETILIDCELLLASEAMDS